MSDVSFTPERPTGRPALLRGLNSLNALSLILQEGPSTASQVASATGLSRTAVESVLTGLVNSDWLVKGAPGTTTLPGRPAAVYDLGRAVGHVGAIEFDSTRIAAAVADCRSQVVRSAQRIAPETLSAADRLRAGTALLRQVMSHAGVALAEILCVAAASPGAIADGRVLHYGGHGLPGWIGCDLAGALTDDLGLPVVVEGDCALGALAERRDGRGLTCDNFVYIYSGRRTGASIVSDGQVRRGSHGGVGLIGELDELRWKEVEATAYDEATGAGTPPADQANTNGQAETEAAGEVADFAAIIGLGISAMVLAVDPEMVLVGGPYRDFIERHIAGIRAEVGRRCPLPAVVELGAFGSEAVLLGAVRLATDTVMDTLRRVVASDGVLPPPGGLAPFLSGNNIAG
ncbi:MAG: ROK family protein [Propionibacteriaceae bacterium]|jgi:predicted NBD/HSP70 family sugar kinase|nr:ROK family protein [Propionibacteriaceae bacterium]